MFIKRFTVLFIIIGIVGLFVPAILIPDVYPEWIAFAPYPLLAIGIPVARGFTNKLALLITSSVVALAGTWVYWDTWQFNCVFSWQWSGLIEDYTPLFQLALVLPVFSMIVWNRIRAKGIEG